MTQSSKPDFNYKAQPGYAGTDSEYQSAVAQAANAISQSVENRGSDLDTELKRRAPQLAQSGINVNHVSHFLHRRKP